MSAEFRHKMPDELHKRVKELAKKYGTSVTGLINTTMKGLTESEGLVALEKRVTELEIEFKLIKKEK